MPELNTDALLNLGFLDLAVWKLTEGGSAIEYTVNERIAGAEVLLSARNSLYAFTLESQVLYIGKTSRTIRDRLSGYRNPSQQQRTNWRCNGKIAAILARGQVVSILVFNPISRLRYDAFEINLAAGLEDSLINAFAPPWNGRELGQPISEETEREENEAEQMVQGGSRISVMPDSHPGEGGLRDFRKRPSPTEGSEEGAASGFRKILFARLHNVFFRPRLDKASDEASCKAEIGSEIPPRKQIGLPAAVLSDVVASSDPAKEVCGLSIVDPPTTNNDEGERILVPVGVASFQVALGKAYYNQGITNPGAAASKHLGEHDEPITIRFADGNPQLQSRIDRIANPGGYVRVVGKNRQISSWFHKNFDMGDVVEGRVLDRNTILLLPKTTQPRK